MGSHSYSVRISQPVVIRPEYRMNRQWFDEPSRCAPWTANTSSLVLLINIILCGTHYAIMWNFSWSVTWLAQAFSFCRSFSSFAVHEPIFLLPFQHFRCRPTGVTAESPLHCFMRSLDSWCMCFIVFRWTFDAVLRQRLPRHAGYIICRVFLGCPFH